MFFKKEKLFIAFLALLVFVCYASMSSYANDNTDNVISSSDFNDNGVVDIPDFLMFVDHFGLSRGNERYEARFDLDGDGTIGISDFLIFVNSFGQKVPAAVVSIPDANLRAIIADSLDKASGAPITQVEMRILTRLEANDSGISDLTGLEFATNLEYLGLVNNKISDISPLSGLTNLTSLDLGSNSISDISVLSSLTNLTRLYLSSNSISDIAPYRPIGSKYGIGHWRWG